MFISQWAHILAFTVIYMSYGSSYLLRMPFGVVKNDLMDYYNVSVKSLGFIDLAFLLPYAVISLLFGGIVENFNPSLILSFCLFISGIAGITIPFCEHYSLVLFCIFIIGAFQSLCWPASCSVISTIFENSKSFIFGIFGTCCFIGGIVGKCLALFLKSHFSYTLVFVIHSIVVISLSIILFILTTLIPRMTQIYDKERKKSGIIFKKLTVWKTFSLPGVLEVSFTMFFVKAIRYTFMFWLPLFLKMTLNYTATKAGYASLSFDIGGIFGSCLIGYTSEKCMKGKDMLICSLSLLGSTLALILFWNLTNSSLFLHFWLLCLAGSLNGGSDVLLCGSVAAKLGKRYERDGVGVTVLTGLVNGMGSLGTVTEGPIVAYVSHWLGWYSVLPLIIIMSIVASLLAMKAHISLE